MQTAEISTKLAKIDQDISQFVQKVNQVIIKNTDDMKNATEYLANIVARKKRIEEIRLNYTKPLNETLRNINADFKKASEPLEQAEKIVKNKMVVYREGEAKKIEEERRKEEERQRKEHEKEMERQRKQAEKEAEKERKRLEKEVLSKKDKQAEIDRIETEKQEKENQINQQQEEFKPEVDIKQDKTVHSESGAVRARKVWKFEIIDENKVPKAYLKVDEMKIRQAVKDGVREINGVKIYEEEQIGVY